jgi:anaerobic magnesium-protoporphyrin IX monomethyl ester cyclase
MKIVVVTVPLRESACSFPPLACFSVISALLKNGYKREDIIFYNVDLLRPTMEESLEFISNEKPDLLAISAPVSTGYNYIKTLSAGVKSVLPETTILLGGNLGASAQIILAKTQVDFICTGEGEKTIVEFVRCLENKPNKDAFLDVKGLCFITEAGKTILTTPPEPLKGEEIYDYDWDLVEQYDHTKYLIVPKAEHVWCNHPRVQRIYKTRKNIVSIVPIKGCVNRCTFCHRWTKGIRYKPLEKVMKEVDYLVNEHSVGFIQFVVEDFGSNPKWTNQFIEDLKDRDIVWTIGGMRVSAVRRDILQRMHDAGCVNIDFGMESGSQKMLDSMEKNTSVEQNRNAVIETTKTGIKTAIQLVIGMPGESPQTINETLSFTSFFAQLSSTNDPNALSINFAQALPGTPLYEFGRRRKLIGQTIDDEEQYLLNISGKDARDGSTTLNFTDYPRLLLENWSLKLQVYTRQAYIEKWGLAEYYKGILKNNKYRGDLNTSKKDVDSGYYASPKRCKETLPELKTKIPSILTLLRQKKLGMLLMLHPAMVWRFRHLLLVLTTVNVVIKYNRAMAKRMILEYVNWHFTHLFKKQMFTFVGDKYMSVRRFLKKGHLPLIKSDDPNLQTLRDGS